MMFKFYIRVFIYSMIGSAKVKRPIPQRQSPRVQVQWTTKQERVRNDRSALPSRRRAQPNSFISRTPRERRRERREDSGSLNRGVPIVGEVMQPFWNLFRMS